ncbi:hypothetical protein [Deinococcus enclensis]|uniref:Uncharacterized protein n=1 Tax=Deinococcus enclensis TaxID=1049582 RepID=A0ABT9MFA3_9DEIO|nr:hypothetical protein [Deinococcus enclensis]MDP9764879.1 hypothetical protein [Deinococcus enclensis]
MSEIKRFRVREGEQDGRKVWVVTVSLTATGEDFMEARVANSPDALNAWVVRTFGGVM